MAESRIDDEYGLEIPQLVIVNVSVPAEVEQALDARTSVGVIGDLDRLPELPARRARCRPPRRTRPADWPARASASAWAWRSRAASRTARARRRAPPPAPAAWHFVEGGRSVGPLHRRRARARGRAGTRHARHAGVVGGHARLDAGARGAGAGCALRRDAAAAPAAAEPRSVVGDRADSPSAVPRQHAHALVGVRVGELSQQRPLACGPPATRQRARRRSRAISGGAASITSRSAGTADGPIRASASSSRHRARRGSASSSAGPQLGPRRRRPSARASAAPRPCAPRAPDRCGPARQALERAAPLA